MLAPSAATGDLEATGNELHARLVRKLREMQFEQTVVMARMSGPLAAPEDEHRLVVEAIERRDPEAARAAMAAHLEAIYQRFQAAERHARSVAEETSGGSGAAA